MLFKITGPRGGAVHGGHFRYSLPKLIDGEWQPGKWHELSAHKRLEPCRCGFHLTEKPAFWYDPPNLAWVAECDGERVVDRDKVVCRKVRLLRPATVKELAKHHIFFDGKYISGYEEYVACDGATVTAKSYSRLVAYTGSTVYARKWSIVRAYTGSTVYAYAYSDVTASKGSIVYARPGARVSGYEKAIKPWVK